MSTDVAVQPFSGTYETDTVHSSFGFSVRHSGISSFRGTLTDVDATVAVVDGALTLGGTAKAESISIQTPPQLRAHVLSEEFFDAEHYPEVAFRSTSVALGEDGTATVEGELTIKGVTRAVTAAGTYAPPQPGAAGRTIAAFELSATFDRREFGFDWQMDLPTGQPALAWDVTLEVHLEVYRQGEEA